MKETSTTRAEVLAAIKHGQLAFPLVGAPYQDGGGRVTASRRRLAAARRTMRERALGMAEMVARLLLVRFPEAAAEAGDLEARLQQLDAHELRLVLERGIAADNIEAALGPPRAIVSAVGEEPS